MSKTVIADSTCLIGLSRTGRLYLLRELFQSILIPPAVYDEVVTSGGGRPGAAEVAAADWIATCEPKDHLAVDSLKITLGAGESEAIVIAREQNADFIILDDWQARQTALGLSLPVIGTVAVLAKAEEKGLISLRGTVAVLAKAEEKGLISDLNSALQELRQAGFYFPVN